MHAGEEIDQLTDIKGLAYAVRGTGKYGICRTGWQAVNPGTGIGVLSPKALWG